MGDFVKVGELKDFREGGRGRVVDLDGAKVAVFRTADGFVAFTDACCHMGASLADGMLRDNQIECGWHGWRYDVRTGRNDEREWACLTVYEVKVDGQDVLLRRPDPPPPGEPIQDDEDWMSRDPASFFRKRTRP